ncbi:MAG: hypothetical protein PVF47_18500 [Anaerolineae bacterium]|jgi:hypothetical protein
MIANNFNLFFPVERTAEVLLGVSHLAGVATTHRTHLVLPDGSMVTVPFTSWHGDGQTILMTPGTRVRLDTFLAFPPGGAGGLDLMPAGEAPAHPPSGESSRPRYVRLWVFMGRRHVLFSFFAADKEVSQLFVTSPAIHSHMSRLLEERGGILGLLELDGDEGYLLPDLQLCVEMPNTLQYYSDRLQVLDVDRWLADLLKQKVRPGSPPAPGERGSQGDGLKARIMKGLGVVFGAHREPLPQRYHRTFAEKPFETCDLCHRPLLVPGTQYLVTKLFGGGELRQEMAMCKPCQKALEKTYSHESRRATAQLFSTVSRGQRLRLAAEAGADRVARLTGHCLLCGAAKEDLETYVEHAGCESNEIVYALYPYMLCEDCLLRAYEVLSEKTRQERGRFYGDHFGFPPPAHPFAEKPQERLLSWRPWR